MASTAQGIQDLATSQAALVNTIALAEERERQLILDEIGQALRKAKEKRDAVVAFLRHCEQQQKFADAEESAVPDSKTSRAQLAVSPWLQPET